MPLGAGDSEVASEPAIDDASTCPPPMEADEEAAWAGAMELEAAAVTGRASGATGKAADATRRRQLRRQLRRQREGGAGGDGHAGGGRSAQLTARG